MPRPVERKYVSGTEMSRMRTKITASAPRAIRISRSGTDAGSVIPASREASRIRVASPTKKTSLPSAPVCQPVTDSVRPLGSVPAYQSVNAEIVRTSPETHARRTPQLPASGVAPSGRGARRSSRIRNGRAGSGVCTAAVWAQNCTGARAARPSEDGRGGAGSGGSGRRVRKEAHSGVHGDAGRGRIRRLLGRGDPPPGRFPFHGRRLRSGRPADAPTLSDVRRDGLGTPGIPRPVASSTDARAVVPGGRPEYFRE